MKQQIDTSLSSSNNRPAAQKSGLTRNQPGQLTKHLRKTPLALAIAGVLAFPALACAAPGDPVGPEFRVNTFTNFRQSLPAVALDADGDFVVVWESYGQDGPVQGIFAQRYNNTGVPQGSEFLVNTTTAGSQRNPAVSTDAAGNFVVVWHGTGGGDGSGIFAQRYNDAGLPQGSEFLVNTITASDQVAPVVSLDADGDFVVAWQSPDGSGSGIFARRFNSAGVPQGNQFQVNTFIASNQLAPTVALDADGDFVVGWQSLNQDGSGFGIFIQRYNGAGIVQGGEVLVNTITDDSQLTPVLDLDDDGDFVVAWGGSYGQDGSFSGVFAQRYNNAGVPQGGEFQVNTFTVGDQFVPTLALDADGDFVVAWQDNQGQDGSSSGIFAQRYNNTGVPQGSEFQVNTVTANRQSIPALALDADGDFVVAWTSPDGFDYGIFAQIFRGNDTSVITCLGVLATLIGTNAGETLTGTAGNDVIVGLGGNDIINGLSGNDMLCDGVTGDDTLNGGDGNDTLVGGVGNDTLNGGADHDILLGEADNDILNGDAGTDTVRFGGAAGVTANLSSGTASGEGSDTLSGVENLIGSSASDSLTGDAGNNTLNGGLGNDSLDGAGGNDTVAFPGATAVIVNLGTGVASGQGSDTLLNLENIIGSSANDILTGNAANNALFGLGGNDALDGAGGSDWAGFILSPMGVIANLTGGTAAGEGTDTLSNIENLMGSRFNDTLTGNALSNILMGLSGNDNFSGQDGHDFVGFGQSPSGVTANLNTGVASGEGSDLLFGIESLLGSSFADILTGNANANVLYGQGGNDSLFGLGGNDSLNGGIGDDALDGGAETDTCNGDAQITADTAVNCETVTGVP